MNDRLETRLLELGGEIDWPAPVDLVPRLTLSLPGFEGRQNRRRRVGLAWVAALVALLSVVVLVPPARQAVADLLDLAGIRVEFGTPGDLPPSPNLTIGDEVDMSAAQEAVAFEILTPAILEAPTEVRTLSWEMGTQVFLIWAASGGLPEVGDSGTGLLLVEFVADLEEPVFTKVLAEDTVIERVAVGGSPAFWISGAPHVFLFAEGGSNLVEDATRLTGNVLIWEVDGVTYRLESDLPLAESLAIAESLR